MRVHIYKGEAGKVALLFEPARGKHRVPVFLPLMEPAEAKARAGEEVAKMRAPRQVT